MWSNASDYSALPQHYAGRLRRRNKLQYLRKVPYGSQAQKLQRVMSQYLESNKVLGAKEFVSPSLEKEFSCAANFNRETVNTVLNFAAEQKVQLMNSMSANALKEGGYEKIRREHDTESESVYKRNRLVIEHVMLQRAIGKISTRQERKHAAQP